MSAVISVKSLALHINITPRLKPRVQGRVCNICIVILVRWQLMLSVHSV